MTTNFTITETELEAIRYVERWIGDEMQKDFNVPSEPPISDEVAILSRLLYRLAPAPPVEEVASTPNGETGQSANVTKLPWPRADNCSGPRRSTPGQGQQCFIHVLGRADKHADSVIPSYGKISAGLAAALGEDFAETIWPVVVKVKPHVVEGDLIQHLRDLADVIESHPKPDHIEELRVSMRRHWTAGINPPELQKVVRRDCPAATLEEFNAAADDVWAEIRQS